MAFQPTTAIAAARSGGKLCVCSTRRPHCARRASSSAGGGPSRVVCLFGSPHPIRGRRRPGLARSRVAVDHRPAGRRRGQLDDASGGRRRSDRERLTSRWQRSSSTDSFICRIPGKFSCKARVIPRRVGGESNSTAALLTSPPHRPHRAELPQWVPQVRLPAPTKPAQLVDWAPLDIHSRVLSLAYVALRRCVYLFAPSLQWVPWPPLSGALRFPTFAGTMSSYDCSLPLPATSGLPWQRVLLVESLFASRGRLSHPSGPGSIRVGLNHGPVRER
jgi:hypothetical protein